MAEITYRKIANDGSNALYGMFERNYMLGTCTEKEMRDTLAMCEKDLARESLFPDNYLKSIKRLHDSLREALEVA